MPRKIRFTKTDKTKQINQAVQCTVAMDSEVRKPICESLPEDMNSKFEKDVTIKDIEELVTRHVFPLLTIR